VGIGYFNVLRVKYPILKGYFAESGCQHHDLAPSHDRAAKSEGPKNKNHDAGITTPSDSALKYPISKGSFAKMSYFCRALL